MQPFEGTFKGFDGSDLYYQVWQAESKPRANIIVVHGFGEHSGRYRNLVAHFPLRGYTVYLYDQRGFGRSPGQRGYVDSWSDYRKDLRIFVNQVTQESPDLPRFLYSHSMGSAVSLSFCLEDPSGLAGHICSSPGIGGFGVSPLMTGFARFMGMIAPRYTQENPINADLISRDKEWVDFILNDKPYGHGKMTARWAVGLLDTADWIQAHAAEWRIPLLMLHGTADGFASVEGSRRFISNVKYPDARLIEYEGAYHELHNDICKHQVFADVDAWLSQHLA